MTNFRIRLVSYVIDQQLALQNCGMRLLARIQPARRRSTQVRLRLPAVVNGGAAAAIAGLNNIRDGVSAELENAVSVVIAVLLQG